MCVYIYIYKYVCVYIYICICMYIYIYTYIEGGGSAGLSLLLWWRGGVVVSFYFYVCRVCRISSVSPPLGVYLWDIPVLIWIWWDMVGYGGMI